MARRSEAFGETIRRALTENRWTLQDAAEAANGATDYTRFTPMQKGIVPSEAMLREITKAEAWKPYAKDLWEASGYRVPDEFVEQPRYCELARELSERTGKPKPDVILEALEDYAARIGA